MHEVGHLAEVLGNLGVFQMRPEDLIAPCPSGFRRVPIGQGDDFYLSLQLIHRFSEQSFRGSRPAGPTHW